MILSRFRILRITAFPLVGLVALFFFWSYAVYQDASWLAVFVITAIIGIASLGCALLVDARAVRLSVGVYKLKYRRRIVAALALLGIGLPIFSILTIALTYRSTESFDLSGIQFYQSGIALLVFFEALAIFASLVIPRKR
jgi:hypothetical protein